VSINRTKQPASRRFYVQFGSKSWRRPPCPILVRSQPEIGHAGVYDPSAANR